MVGRDDCFLSYNIGSMGYLRKSWKLWARALGGKEGSDKEADIVAIWRTLIVLQAFIANVFIVWNILRKW